MFTARDANNHLHTRFSHLQQGTRARDIVLSMPHPTEYTYKFAKLAEPLLAESVPATTPI